MQLNIDDNLIAGLPANNVGNTLAAQRVLNATAAAVAETLGTTEAAHQSLRVSRFLGFAPKSTRGAKPKSA